MLKLAPEDPYSHYYDALVHLRAGDEDKALEALEIAADKGYSKRDAGARNRILHHCGNMRNSERS